MKRTQTVLAALFIAFSATGHADGSPFQSFFSSIEGRWAGTGVVHQLGADGTVQDLNYKIDIQADRSQQPDTWTLSNQLTKNLAAYTISGDLLLVSTQGSTEPVQIVQISPMGLTYTTQRTDFMTGRNYSFTFHVEIDASGNSIIGENTTQTNGVTIQDESFAATRW